MKKNTILLFIAVAALASTLGGRGQLFRTGMAMNVASANATNTSYATDEANWVSNCCVLADGAVTISPGGSINPYFANSTAQALLKAGTVYYPVVKNYIQWYFNHLNKPDNLGVYGTVYDYDVISGIETSKGTYDSSDSYAATFLTLIRNYYDLVSDKQFIQDNLNNLKLVATAMDSTLRTDGLTNAKANYQIAYLMDNVEVWKGYGDFVYLLGQLGDSSTSAYAAKADKTRSSIESLLWDPVNDQYNWYVGGTTNFTKFYPDATANMWPVIFRLPEAKSRTPVLYQKFITNHPSWVTLQADPFPWVSISLAALEANDMSTASQFETNMRAKFFPARAWPWNTGESGWYIKYSLWALQVGDIVPPAVMVTYPTNGSTLVRLEPRFGGGKCARRRRAKRYGCAVKSVGGTKYRLRSGSQKAEKFRMSH